jgi:hypothetical protein
MTTFDAQRGVAYVYEWLLDPSLIGITSLHPHSAHQIPDFAGKRHMLKN